MQVRQPRVPPFEAIGLAFVGGPFGVVRPHVRVVVVECRRQGQDYVALVRGDVDGNAMHTAPSIVVWTAASTHWARLQRRGGRGRCRCWKRWSQGLRADRFGPFFWGKPTRLGSVTARLRPYAPRRHGETGASCAAQRRPRSSVPRGLRRPPWRRFPKCGAWSQPLLRGRHALPFGTVTTAQPLRVRAPTGRRRNRVRYEFSRHAKHRRPICVRWPRGSTWPSLNQVLLRRRRQIGWRSPRDRD